MEQSQVEQTQTNSQEQMFQIGLENIRTDFKRSLKEKLSDIEQFMHLIETGEDGASALKKLSESAHKFRGAAATLGFVSLGAAAGELEDCISELKNPERDATEMASMFLERFRQFVGEITELA